MNPTQHPSNNSVLQAPPDVSIEECRPLAITRVRYDNDVPALWSYWRPTDAELQALNQGKLVKLSITGVTHPPLWVGVDGVEQPEVPAPDESAVQVLTSVLLAQAAAAGLVVTIEQRPLLPLAMGNYESVATFRKARGA